MGRPMGDEPLDLTDIEPLDIITISADRETDAIVIDIGDLPVWQALGLLTAASDILRESVGETSVAGAWIDEEDDEK